MDVSEFMANRAKKSIVDQPIVKSQVTISLSAFSLLFCELVEYSQAKSSTIQELQTRLADAGRHIGYRIIDLIVNRDKNFRRETRVINMLMFIKTVFWRALFNKEADKLEQANDDSSIYYLIEQEPITNKFVSTPKDKGNFNCASFIAGIIEASLEQCCFPNKVSVHWHQGTTFMIKFDDSVVKREKRLTTK
uniref:Trafficking protein particle complex subunit 5 n=1 Tax=Aceria tosichella TaxID=561515 RepID=A0A6G1SPS1_9ACAR